MSSKDVYIVAAARTPIGSFNGSLGKMKASEYSSIVLKEVLKRANVNPVDVDEVIIGQTLTAGQGQNPARQASLKAGLPIEVPAYTINMLCGSGIKTIVLGLQSIRCGDAKIALCGGQEGMSMAPHVVAVRQCEKIGSLSMQDTILRDGLTDAMCDIHMAVTGENLAKIYGITRAEQDEYALKSQKLAQQAQQNGYFNDEIVPIEVVDSRKNVTLFSRDEYVRSDCSKEGLEKLKPCFLNDGTVTAGNCSGVNDSAAAVVLMSAEEMQKRGCKALCKIVAWAQTGCKPEIMGIGPVSAVEEVLKKAGWSKDDVDLFELNEASAAQALAVLKALQVNSSKVNINGGAIALGHPISASGTRILVTLIYALQRIDGRKGVASLCIGGGMGIAMAVERV